VCLIEWPQRIENMLTGDELTIDFNFDEPGRTALISGGQEWSKRMHNP
jgi:tRNA A37 threonylcarbamoyladenosine biosynthesis protein TsaE